MTNMVNVLANIPTKAPTAPKGNKTQGRESFKDLVVEKSNGDLTQNVKDPKIEGKEDLPKEVSVEEIAMMLNGQFVVLNDLIVPNEGGNVILPEVPNVKDVGEVNLMPVPTENTLIAEGIDVNAMAKSNMTNAMEEVPVFVQPENTDKTNDLKPVNANKNNFTEAKPEIKSVPLEPVKVNVEAPVEVVVKQTEISVQKPIINGEVITVNTDQNKKNSQELGVNPTNIGVVETEMPDVQKVSFKVGDTVNANSAEFAKDVADKIIYKATGKSNEFEISLNPKELGKINIKLVFEGGKAEISIICANQKAYNLLSENASTISSIIKESTGNQTNIVVQENKEFFNEQKNDDGRSQNGKQNQEQENSKRNSENAALDFVQQLRLGMFELA